jgi:uncharacterized protein with ParB-like and HNH nuclease domain
MSGVADLLDADIVPLWHEFAPPTGNGRLFFVPSYQRPYAWEKRQLEDFWNDIDLAFRQSPDSPYLLGTLYLANVVPGELAAEISAAAWEQYVPCWPQAPLLDCRLIIDGQQRMTTFFLLCLCLSLDRLTTISLRNW